MIARLACLVLGHRRLTLIARIRPTAGTPTPHLDLACERCHR